MSFSDFAGPGFCTLPNGAPMARAADSVSATISQDRTAGATAAEESSFGMLAGHDTAGAGGGGNNNNNNNNTINPALLADTTKMPYSRRPPNFGAPPSHSPAPVQMMPQHGPQQLTPWGAEYQRLLPMQNHPQPMSNHALQDYQMQLMLLEQQNKKRLMMARMEQDGISDDVDMDVAQPTSSSSGNREAKTDQNVVSTPKQASPKAAPMASEPTATNTAPAAAVKPAASANVQSQPPPGDSRTSSAMQPSSPEMQWSQPPLLPLPVSPPPPPPPPQAGVPGMPSTTPIQALQLAQRRAAQINAMRAQREAMIAAHASAPNVPVQTMRAVQTPPIQLQAMRAARATAEGQSNLQQPAGPACTLTAHQLTAQRDAIRRGELMAWSMAGEREKWLQESNNRLKAQMAQLWEWNRKMMTVGPGQPFPGTPAILMAQNEQSLFSDEPSAPKAGSARDGQLDAPEVEKNKPQDEARVPNILLPGPGLPYHSEQQVSPAQPGSPGSGRKRSRDESAVQTKPGESSSNSIKSPNDEHECESPLREKRSRVVPVNTTLEEQPQSVEDNDWECVAISTPATGTRLSFDGSVIDFSKPDELLTDGIEDLLDPRLPASPCTLPDLDDALMADVDADASRELNVVAENQAKGEATAPMSTADHAEDPHQHFRTLHRVQCSKSACRCKTYAEIPHLTQDHPAGPGHLAGDTLLADLKTYATQQRSVKWVVFRDYQCPLQTSRNWNNPNESTCNEIHVLSADLKRTLTSILRCMPEGDAPPRNNANSFNRPPPAEGVYRPRTLYHHRDLLQNILANEPARTDISALLWFLEHESPDSGRLKSCDFMFKQGKVCVNTLPWLYCPNSIVISNSAGPNSNSPAAYVLEDWPYEIDGGVQLNCWSWGYDGQSLQRRQTCFFVKVARDTTVDITSLSVYPAAYMAGEVGARLVARGKQFWGYRHQHHVSYQGWDYQKERKYAEGSRCMIDYRTYRKFHSTAAAFSFSHSVQDVYDKWPAFIDNTSNPSDENLMLLPPEIHGFFLKDKRWVCLCLDQIKPVAWNKLAFERLVLPQKTKTLVQAMVMPRASKDAEAEPEVRGDLIAGKGNGLIMLLHGPPGTGKTLTAESVAELAEMPLYSVTCGDIGTSPEAVERYLSTVLHLGKTWNCVLLLDEADVFLEQRSMADLDRNSLVSVFLRTLEYYSGILILTSNRVSIFDEAFKSRIQVALSYPRLDKASRERVWANFVNMMHEDGGRAPSEAGGMFAVDYPSIVSHMDDLADCELNGRQIRNAMATARQLAGYLGETLNWEHLETAITTASDFTISQAAN